MRRFLAVVLLLVLAAAAISQMVLRLDYVDTRAAGGETEVLEEGSLYFAPDGRFRHDVERRGERTTEIMLPLSEERVTMNHAERTAVRGWLHGSWPAASAEPRPEIPMQPDESAWRTVGRGRLLREPGGPENTNEGLGRREIGGVGTTGSRPTSTWTGWRRVEDTWLTSLSRQLGIPVTLERTIRVVRDGAVSVEERRRVTATVQVPLDEDLFSVAEGYEVEAP